MLRQRGRQIYFAFMAVDALIVVVLFAVMCVRFLRGPGGNTQLGFVTLIGLAAAFGLAWPLILGRFGVYNSQRRDNISQTLARLLASSGLGGLLLSVAAFGLDAPLAPAFPMLLAFAVFGVQAGFRIPLYLGLNVARRSGRNTRNVIVLGAGPRAARALNTIEQHPEWGLRVLGFVDDCDGDFIPSVPVDRVEKFVELPALLRDSTVDEVLVACPRSMLDTLGPSVRECATIGVPVTILTDLFGDELPPPKSGRFDSAGTLSYAPVHHNELELAIKRGVDFVGGLVGLVITAPVLATAAIAIRLDDKGPVLFRQWRCGVNGRQFPMLKLRTMVRDADEMKSDLMHLNEMDGPVFKMKDDPRVTRVGAVLRRWSIDELPQFWNVVRGDMSLVGPRPPTPDEVGLYEGGERRRLSMRPGLTCLWALHGRSDITFDEWMRLDLEYIDNWRLGQDFRILAGTLPLILTGRGAS
ncbi:MAG: sugar transferase [Myxococcota bacterium]|nr:sugar transferase [Myxococcota bacterium]